MTSLFFMCLICRMEVVLMIMCLVLEYLGVHKIKT